MPLRPSGAAMYALMALAFFIPALAGVLPSLVLKNHEPHQPPPAPVDTPKALPRSADPLGFPNPTNLPVAHTPATSPSRAPLCAKYELDITANIFTGYTVHFGTSLLSYHAPDPSHTGLLLTVGLPPIVAGQHTLLFHGLLPKRTSDAPALARPVPPDVNDGSMTVALKCVPIDKIYYTTDDRYVTIASKTVDADTALAGFSITFDANSIFSKVRPSAPLQAHIATVLDQSVVPGEPLKQPDAVIAWEDNPFTQPFFPLIESVLWPSPTQPVRVERIYREDWHFVELRLPPNINVPRILLLYRSPTGSLVNALPIVKTSAESVSVVSFQAAADTEYRVYGFHNAMIFRF